MMAVAVAVAAAVVGVEAAPLVPVGAGERCGFKAGEDKEKCECVAKADAADSDLGSALSWLCGQPALNGALAVIGAPLSWSFSFARRQCSWWVPARCSSVA